MHKRMPFPPDTLPPDTYSSDISLSHTHTHAPLPPPSPLLPVVLIWNTSTSYAGLPRICTLLVVCISSPPAMGRDRCFQYKEMEIWRLRAYCQLPLFLPNRPSVLLRATFQIKQEVWSAGRDLVFPDPRTLPVPASSPPFSCRRHHRVCFLQLKSPDCPGGGGTVTRAPASPAAAACTSSWLLTLSERRVRGVSISLARPNNSSDHWD